MKVEKRAPVRTLDTGEIAEAIRMYLTVTDPDVFGNSKLSLTFRAAQRKGQLLIFADLRPTTTPRETRT